MRRILSILLLAAFGPPAGSQPLAADEPTSKHRVVILSDMSNEPDDQQSLVRFLTYANEFKVEGQ